MQLIGKMFETFRTARDEKIRHLERVPLFEDCSLRQLRAVADISSVVEVPARTVLTRAGEPGDEFFVIIDGTALVALSPQRRHRINPGEFFGEMSLLDGEPRSATVKAETDLRLLVIDRTHFWRLLKEVPGLTEKILVTLSRRGRQHEKPLRARRTGGGRRAPPQRQRGGGGIGRANRCNPPTLLYRIPPFSLKKKKIP